MRGQPWAASLVPIKEKMKRLLRKKIERKFNRLNFLTKAKSKASSGGQDLLDVPLP